MSGKAFYPTHSDDRRAVLQQITSAYLNAFNCMDMNTVMNFFAPDALYEPGDGSRYVGRDAIEQAFKPQLSYAYGAMFFEEEDLFLDAEAHKAVLRWTCRIDLTKARFYSAQIWGMMALARVRYGTQASYRGLDVLHFDTEGRISVKLSYAQFARLRLFKDALSVRPGTDGVR